MRKNTNYSKLIKHTLGLAVAVGSGIVVARIINKRIHETKETYQISVNFDDDNN